eukprot:594119-Alexandrium_andersonii.AAC.1
MAYRGLLVTSVLYRCWAKARLRDLKDWQAKWAPRHMYAGIPGVGAADAWYNFGIEAEAAKLEGHAT